MRSFHPQPPSALHRLHAGTGRQVAKGVILTSPAFARAQNPRCSRESKPSNVKEVQPRPEVQVATVAV